jgi:hypothetical protein
MIARLLAMRREESESGVIIEKTHPAPSKIDRVPAAHAMKIANMPLPHA